MTVLTQDDLLRICNLKRKADLRRHLRKAGIPFREPGGQITTTEEAFTAILVGRGRSKKPEPNWAALDGD